LPWIIEKGTVPPMEFAHLRVLINDSIIQSAIDELMERKLISDEKTMISPVMLLNEWLSDTLSACKTAVPELPATNNGTDELNAIFRKYVTK
jgi:predicted nucleotidyltransferase